MSRFGLVLQGGGMRGIYTAGVLDCFLEHGLIAPYVVAVSAGACNALTYLAREKGLGKSIYIEHLCDMRFFSWRNLFRYGCMLGLDCLFDEIRRHVRPLAFDVFSQSKEKLVVVATNFQTGESVYFSKDEHKEFLLAVRASCSIPLLSGVVQYQGVTLLDGGLADPIPIEKSLQDGNERVIVVRTGTEEYVRQPVNLSWLGERLFPRYKNLVRVLFDHHRRYNEALARIRSLREEKRAFVITPSQPVRIRRVERNPAGLLDLYNLGYQDASRALEPLFRWIES